MKVGRETALSDASYELKLPWTVFRAGRWAAGFAATLAVIAMLIYPGGTLRDHTTRGYSFFHNFLSDLGSTVTFSGQPNSLGALLFVASLAILVLGLGASLAGLVRLFTGDPATRNLARAAGAVGALVCASFLGVAMTPENRFLALHIQFTLWAFRLFPIVPLLLTVATARSGSFPRRSTIAWLLLTCILAAYVVDLQFGPRVSTNYGLAFQVTAQKIVAVASVLIIVYQGVQADHLLLRRAYGNVAPP